MYTYVCAHKKQGTTQNKKNMVIFYSIYYLLEQTAYRSEMTPINTEKLRGYPAPTRSSRIYWCCPTPDRTSAQKKRRKTYIVEACRNDYDVNTYLPGTFHSHRLQYADLKNEWTPPVVLNALPLCPSSQRNPSICGFVFLSSPFCHRAKKHSLLAFSFRACTRRKTTWYQIWDFLDWVPFLPKNRNL